ncbi:MAG: hypothetical protein ABSG68_19980, partial [Thermoguttaceae bacterium]
MADRGAGQNALGHHCGEIGVATTDEKSPPDRGPLSLAELEAAIWAAEPAVRLVLPRVLRRVIRQHCGVAGFAFKVPHPRSFVLARQPLLEIVEPAELGGRPDVLPETVILLERPGQEELAATAANDMLLRYWQAVFHGRVHLELQRQIAAGKLSRAEVRRRIEQLGAVEFDEIRNVLRQENLLLPPADDQTVYVEFAAVYLELKHFSPSLLSSYFPACSTIKGDSPIFAAITSDRPAKIGTVPASEPWEAADRVLGQDVDAGQLLGDTRPHGATAAVEGEEPSSSVSSPAWEPFFRADGAAGPGPWTFARFRKQRRPAARKYARSVRRAEKAAAAGNVVGSIIYRVKGEMWVPRETAAQARAGIRDDIHRLVARLASALEIVEADRESWRDLLTALARQTGRGIWTAEARLLYDLQKVCIDHERDIYTVDLVEWLLWLGRRPIQRPLPNQREVLMSKHLRSAARRLAVVRLSNRQRQHLSELLRGVTGRAEDRLRQKLRPILAQTLDDVELRPRNLPERVARKRLIEELLDRIVERGFLNLGDVRDALSRNNLKQADFSRLADFLHGDALLRADRRLSLALDGVYQRGEFYLRWMQQLSALAFGTPKGRFFTRYLAVPFGGAWLLFAFVEHLVGFILGSPEEKMTLVAAGRILLESAPLGLVLLGLFNSERFRKGLWRIIKTSYRALSRSLAASARWLVGLPLVQQVLHSPLTALVFRFALKPAAVTALFWKVLPRGSGDWQHTLGAGILLFLGVNLLLNSRAGRNVEELLTDWVVEAWHRFGVRVIAGAFWLIVDLFRGFLRTVERLLYTVDEWLRFRSGENRATLAAKAGLGFVWFFVAYVTRFGINLLIEPQINPLKHFPVVTVSHKILWPLATPPLAGLLELTMSKGLAYTVAGVVVFFIPGIFGFLAWELKENWRLYAANRPRGLRPAPIGPHGETVVRLLKPGFHSGTLPKRFAKLRRAERSAAAERGAKAVRKHRQALQRIELSVRRYMEREFLALFTETARWTSAMPQVDEIRFGTNRITTRIRFPDASEADLEIVFEAKSGWILADTSEREWGGRLAEAQQQVLRMALVGLYKTAGAELLRRQIESALPQPTPAYDVTEE